MDGTGKVEIILQEYATKCQNVSVYSQQTSYSKTRSDITCTQAQNMDVMMCSVTNT